MTTTTTSPAFIGGLPSAGPWTTVGLTRAQFVAIFTASVAVFVIAGGPLWSHLHDRHFVRLTSSYLLIPAMVASALWWNGRLTPARLLAGSAVIGLAKLVATAGLMVVLTLAR